METTRIALAALALLALLSQSALCQQVWQEQRITSTLWWETSPIVWEDKIYYSDGRSGSGDICVWDAANGSQPLITGPGSQIVQGMFAGRLVYTDRSGSAVTLRLWDSIGGSQVVCSAPGDRDNAVISESLIAWEDYRSGTPQVYVWDPANGERAISPTSAEQRYPKVWGDTVVWEDTRNGRTDVYMWNPRDGERRLSTYISGMMAPAIYGDRVTMWLIGGSFPEDSGLWEWTPDHGLKQLAQKNYTDPYSVLYSRMWGDMVVWQQGFDYSKSVCAWDPTNGFTRVNQSAIGAAGSPAIYGNQVAWVGNYDIYLSTLVPEPSGLAALGFSACLLWPMIRLRRRGG